MSDASFLNLSSEEKLLVSKISDWVYQSDKYYTPKFSFFLDERQCIIAQNALKQINCSNYIFFGGYENSIRKVLCIYPSFYDISSIVYPITPLKFSYRKSDELGHRDFLGSLMAMNIKREVVGDILVDSGQTIVFVYSTFSDYIIQNTSKVGSVGVSVDIYEDNVFERKEDFIEIKGTVASLRLDCIVSLATKLSREKSVDLIKSSFVDVNCFCVNETNKTINVGDVLSIRKYGKFVLQSVNGVSKKERIHVTINKFI